MKKLFSIILFFVAVAVGLQAEVVWTGSHSVASWQAEQLPITNYAVLSKASAGDVIAITVSAVDGNARITLQNTSWQGLVDEYNVAVGVHPFALTEAMAAEINTNGLIITGENYTFTKVELLYQTPLWTGTLDGTNDWTQSDALNSSSLAALSAGSILGFEIAEIHESEWHSYALRANYETNPIEGWISDAKTYLHVLSAADVTALQSQTIVLLARYLKITGFYTYNEHKYYLSGINSNWSTIAYPMVEQDGIWSYTFTPTSSWNEFKITRGTWEAGYNWGPSAIDNEASELVLDEYNNNGNIHFNSYGEDITICWNPATSKVWAKVGNLSSLTATIAGTDALCGSSWSATDETNDMVLQDGVYTWTKSNIYVSESTDVEYKSVMNHDWDYAAFGKSDGSNCTHTLTPGYHDVVITFTWKDKSLRIQDLCYPKVELAGEFNSWTPDGHEMEWAADRSRCTITVNLTQGETYGFRIVKNDATTWLGCNATMKRYTCTDWSLAEDYNCSILADETGTYTFAYDKENGHVSVTYPNTYTRNFTEVKFGTICLPAAATLSNAVVYTVESVAESTITIAEAGGELEAGRPYIIKPIVAGDVVATFCGTPTVDSPVNDYLYGNFDLTKGLTADDNAYILSGGEFRLIADEATATVGLYRAYLKMTDASATAPALRIVEAENNTTDYRSLDADDNATKFMENGQLFIKKNGVVYDATGRVVR